MAGLPWGINRDSLSHLSQVDMNINISTATRGKLHAPHIVQRWELIPCLSLKIWANFPPAPQVEFSLSKRYVKGTLCSLSQVEGPRETLTQQTAGLPCSGLNSGSCYISQDGGMSESPVETLEKAIVLRLIWIVGITSLWYIERHTEFKASKVDDAWLFLKMDSNPKITVPTRKWALVSCLNSRSVCIVLPSLV